MPYHIDRTAAIATGLLLGLLALASCSGTTPTQPTVTPEISISGVEDGGTYSGPVTISFSVDRGSLSATLNDAVFYSGSTVTAPGAYVLEVTARADGTEVVERIGFTVEFTGERVLILRMIDLGAHVDFGGGGDALLLTDSSAAGMVHGMVDAGPGGFQTDVIRYDHVATRIADFGVDTLQFLQLTHAHADHYAGMSDVLERVHVRRFLYNGQPRTLTGYQNTLAAAQEHADTVSVLTSEREIHLGSGAGATRTVHIPGLPDHLDVDTNDSRMLNEGSLATYVEQGGVRIFLTGDGEDEANARWRTSFAGYSSGVDILKVGHHGANNAIFDDRVGTSSASSWLAHTSPRIHLITANGRSHPRQRALNRLMGIPETETYCTNVHGTVEVRVSSDGRVNVTVERNATADCVPGSEATT